MPDEVKNDTTEAESLVAAKTLLFSRQERSLVLNHDKGEVNTTVLGFNDVRKKVGLL